VINPRAPDGDLPPIPNLAEKLAHLRGKGFLSVRVEAGMACVSCGPRVRELCRNWGSRTRGLHSDVEGRRAAPAIRV